MTKDKQTRTPKAPFFWWAVGLTVLLFAAVIGFYLVVPYVRVRRAVDLVREGKCDPADACSQLGGAAHTVRGVRFYLQLSGPHRKTAILLLGECGEESVLLLMTLLKAKGTDDRLSSLAALERIGRDAHAATELVEELMADEKGKMLLSSIRVHFAVTGGNGKTMEGVLRALKSTDAGVQTEAVFMLPKLSHVVEDMRVKILELLPSLCDNAKIEAARSLWRISKTGDASNRILEKYFGVADNLLVTRACLVARDMGPEARNLADECLTIVAQKNRGFASRRAAVLALAAMENDSPSILRALESLAQGKDKSLSRVALKALEKIKKVQKKKQGKAEPAPEKKPVEAPAK